MTIGADTALHRITEAIDAISSTASSHRRTFVVEVMGRHCGYLALMGALATGADWVFLPEQPPESDALGSRDGGGAQGRPRGRAARRDRRPLRGRDRPAGAARSRASGCGRCSRPGWPSRSASRCSATSSAAARRAPTTASSAPSSATPPWRRCSRARPTTSRRSIGIRGNRVVRIPLAECVSKTREINARLEAARVRAAPWSCAATASSPRCSTLQTLLRALPHPPQPGQRRLRLAILNVGAPAPGMNTAVRAAVRIAIDQGHEIFGVRRGFQGLIDDDIQQMAWMSVNGWAPLGGAELGTNRVVPSGPDFHAIAKTIEQRRIDGLLDHRRLGGLPGRLPAARGAGELPRLRHPDGLPAGHDRQQPAGHRAEHRRRHGAQQHRRPSSTRSSSRPSPSGAATSSR